MLRPQCAPASGLYGLMRGCIAAISSRYCSVDISKLRPSAAYTTDAADDKPTTPMEYLDSLVNFEVKGLPEAVGTSDNKDFNLQRMRRLLGGMDDPHKKYPIVHVAGSKGKGSTVTILTSILREAGAHLPISMPCGL